MLILREGNLVTISLSRRNIALLLEANPIRFDGAAGGVLPRAGGRPRMTACLLWPLPEAARQLGGLSVRTVRRLIERGEIPMVRVGRRVTVPAEAVRAWVARGMSHAHNSHRAGRGAGKGGNSRCHTSARTVRSGGSASSIRAGSELDALLEPRTGKKQKL